MAKRSKSKKRRPGRYYTGLASVLTGVGIQTIGYWARTGLITPSVRDSDGQAGRIRNWSYADLVALRTAKRLRESGIPLQAIRRVVAELRRNEKNDTHPLASKRLVTDGRDVFVVHGDKELVSVLRRPGQRAWTTVMLGDVERDLSENWTKWKRARDRRVKREKSTGRRRVA